VRRAAAVFLAVLVLSATAAPADEPRLVLTTWGMPGEPRFVVELFANGKLRVTREAPPFDDEGKLSKKVIERRISRAKADRIFKLAADATDFASGCGRVSDGTSASLLLRNEKTEIHRTCHNADVWPNGRRARAMLNAINAVVPGDMRVY
jgi:hypothetical protein